jgi:hypothetical protein
MNFTLKFEAVTLFDDEGFREIIFSRGAADARQNFVSIFLLNFEA